MLDNVSYILGIELICALQAVDLIGKKPSAKLEQLHKKLRERITFMEEDFYFGPQI